MPGQRGILTYRSQQPCKPSRRSTLPIRHRGPTGKKALPVVSYKQYLKNAELPKREYPMLLSPFPPNYPIGSVFLAFHSSACYDISLPRCVVYPEGKDYI